MSRLRIFAETDGTAPTFATSAHAEIAEKLGQNEDCHANG